MEPGMRPVSAPTAGKAGPAHRGSDEWRERAGRLYEDLQRPARAMVRRAFRGAFSDHEIEDIYSGAWVGTLRTLKRRQSQLSDDEIRKYVLTAVANQASRSFAGADASRPPRWSWSEALPTRRARQRSVRPTPSARESRVICWLRCLRVAAR